MKQNHPMKRGMNPELKCRIQTALPEHLDLLIAFQQAMAKESEGMELSQKTLYEGIKAVLENPTKGKYYIALHGNEVAGCMMHTYEWSDWRNAYVIWIQSVYVKPEYRRRGVFRQFYAFTQKQVQENKQFCGIRLYVEQNNEAAIATYRALGMDDGHYRLFEWMP